MIDILNTHTYAILGQLLSIYQPGFISKYLRPPNFHEKRPLKMDALRNTIWDKEKSKFALTHYLFFVRFTWDPFTNLLLNQYIPVPRTRSLIAGKDATRQC